MLAHSSTLQVVTKPTSLRRVNAAPPMRTSSAAMGYRLGPFLSSTSTTSHGLVRVAARPQNQINPRKSHPPPAAAVPPNTTASTLLFATSTVFTTALILLMIIAPRWPRTHQLVESPWCISPVAIAYGVLLCWSWQPDTFSLILPGNLAVGLSGGFKPQFFPSLTGIVTLFSRVATAASLWVHILAINLFAAREMYVDGGVKGVPTGHSLVFCLIFLGPLGLLSHAATVSWTNNRKVIFDLFKELIN